MENESKRQPSLINRAYARRVALDIGSQRAHKLTRVSKEFLDYLDREVRTIIQQKVNNLPSVGKTIVP